MGKFANGKIDFTILLIVGLLVTALNIMLLVSSF